MELTVLSTRQAAKLLAISIVSLRRLVHAGVIVPYMPLGSRLWLFPETDIQNYRENRTRRIDYTQSPAVKRPTITKNVADVNLSENVKAFERLFGLGMPQVWDLFLSYCDPKTGRAEIVALDFCNQGGFRMEYVRDCLSFWSRWGWITQDYQIGTTKIHACLVDPSGAVPATGIRTITDAELQAALGDQGMYELNDNNQVVPIPSETIVETAPVVEQQTDLIEAPEYERLATMTQKEARKVKTSKNEVRPEVQAVIDHWIETAKKWNITKRQPLVNGDLDRKIRLALSQYGQERVFHAVEGCFMRDFNREGGHISLELICRDNKHIEDYESIYDNIKALKNRPGFSAMPGIPIFTEAYVPNVSVAPVKPAEPTPEELGFDPEPQTEEEWLEYYEWKFKTNIPELKVRRMGVPMGFYMDDYVPVKWKEIKE